MHSLWLAAILAQSFDSSGWTHRARAGTADTEYAEFVVSRDLMTKLRPGFGDLRLTRDGRELAYTIERRGAASQPYDLASQVVDEAFTQSGDLVLVLDFGERTRPHDRVEFSVNREDFRFPVRIETSDDRRTWLIARREATIAGFSQDGSRIALKSVSYPRSSKRYLRATVGGVKEPKIVAAIRSLRFEERPAELEQVAVLEPSRSTDARTKTTTIEFDFGANHVLHDRVALETAARQFYRAATIETSADRQQWRYLSTTALSRVDGHDDLTPVFGETGDRYLRIRVYNGDDPPIAITRGTFSSVRRVVIFPGGAGETWAFAGSSSASAPHYDFERLRSQRTDRAATRVSLGAPEANPAYHPPAPPVTERAPWVLYSVLGVAVLLMGAAAVRMMKKASVAPR